MKDVYNSPISNKKSIFGTNTGLGTTQEENVKYNPILRAKQHHNSKKLAIAAFCFHCMGGNENNFPDPGWRDAIRNCTAPTCPLYPQRPYRK